MKRFYIASCILLNDSKPNENVKYEKDKWVNDIFTNIGDCYETERIEDWMED